MRGRVSFFFLSRREFETRPGVRLHSSSVILRHLSLHRVNSTAHTREFGTCARICCPRRWRSSRTNLEQGYVFVFFDDGPFQCRKRGAAGRSMLVGDDPHK